MRLRGCLKSPGRSRLTVQESGFVPAASRVEWRNIVGENDGIGTFQTPSKRCLQRSKLAARSKVGIHIPEKGRVFGFSFQCEGSSIGDSPSTPRGTSHA